VEYANWFHFKLYIITIPCVLELDLTHSQNQRDSMPSQAGNMSAADIQVVGMEVEEMLPEVEEMLPGAEDMLALPETGKAFITQC
jgi:hypothetical protein